jgi:ABC-type oligopeptide transport system ATPase subunit
MLNAENISKFYYSSKIFGKKEKITAVKNFSLHIHKNQIIGLVGESGSGKSTVARLFIGLEKPDKGNIFYNNKNISHFNKKEFKEFRRKTQYIFQNPFSSLNPRFKIGKSIEEPLIIHKTGTNLERKEKVVQIMEQCGLKADYYNRYPHQLSGGQCQRAAIARSLVLNPEFIIADEPTSSLDVSIQAQILNLLKELHEKFSLTMLFITHDLSVIRFIATKIVVMKNGKIVENKDADEFFKNPESEYSKKLLDSILGAA